MFSHSDLCNAMLALFNQAEAHDRAADARFTMQSSDHDEQTNADHRGLASWHRTRAGQLRASAAVFAQARKAQEK